VSDASENTPKAGKRKAPKTAFKPGQSGNPGGRPKLRELVRERCASAVDELVVAAWEAEVRSQGPDWVKCSELLAAYGIGKPSSAPEDLDAVRDGNRPLRDIASNMLARVATVKDADWHLEPDEIKP
jgi:hypothetical protein